MYVRRNAKITAPKTFTTAPTKNIHLNEVPLTSPNANAFTGVAIGVINAHVDDSATAINPSIVFIPRALDIP